LVSDTGFSVPIIPQGKKKPAQGGLPVSIDSGSLPRFTIHLTEETSCEAEQAHQSGAKRLVSFDRQGAPT
jgi:hypothetical protein